MILVSLQNELVLLISILSKNSLYQIEIIKNESFLKKSSKSITTYYDICECELLFLTNFFS